MGIVRNFSRNHALCKHALPDPFYDGKILCKIRVPICAKHISFDYMECEKCSKFDPEDPLEYFLYLGEYEPKSKFRLFWEKLLRNIRNLLYIVRF